MNTSPNYKPLITLTSDFGLHSQSVGVMEAVALSIAPDASVVHLMHGLPAYNISAAARTLECVKSLDKTSTHVHVCVCDPGVGTSRKAIICCTARGDYLVGPDNGVLRPAAYLLGGLTAVYQITNTKYMRLPVSPIFHGRDIFVPAAAHIARGISPDQFGQELDVRELVAAPYDEAVVTDNRIYASVIQINAFGSLHLNILHSLWDSLDIKHGAVLQVIFSDRTTIEVTASRVFADVPPGGLAVLKDDYGRVELAKNLGSLVSEYPVKVGETVILCLK